MEVVRKISRVPVMGQDAVYPSLAAQPVDAPLIKSLEIITVSEGPKVEEPKK